MHAIARWLVARPHNAVLGLAVTVLMPAPQLFSGAVIALLVLEKGVRRAALEAIIAAAMLAVAYLILGGTLTSVVVLLVGAWIPVILLTMLLMAMRSLTLTMQVSVIGAVAAMLLFQVAVPDQAAFWQPYLDVMDAVIRENGLQLDTELLTAEIMTVSAVLVFWMFYTAALLLGYWLYRGLPRETVDFGRFRDLNFGRVIALTMAVLSVLALVIGVAWLSNVAIIVFVMFMMQGLALVHWLHGEGILPIFAVVSVYLLIPFLQVLLVFVLAMIGYTDAWIGIRRRLKKA